MPTYVWVIRQHNVATNHHSTPLKISKSDTDGVLISVIIRVPAENLIEVYYGSWQIQVIDYSSRSSSVTPSKRNA